MLFLYVSIEVSLQSQRNVQVLCIFIMEHSTLLFFSFQKLGCHECDNAVLFFECRDTESIGILKGRLLKIDLQLLVYEFNDGPA